MAERYRPFSCGSQDIDWQNSNCCRCTKYSEEFGTCELQDALTEAYWGDGTVSAEIAERMGYLANSPPRRDGFAYVWQCPEVDWTPEWKAECADREAERLTGILPGMEAPDG